MEGGGMLNSRGGANNNAKLCGKVADKSPVAVSDSLEYAAGGGAIAVIIVTLLAFGVSSSTLLLAVLSSLLGYLLTALCLNNPSACEGLRKAFYRYFKLVNNESPRYSVKENALPDVNNINENFYRIPPWNSLRIGRRLNLTLERFFERLIEHYVESWYKQEISEDNTFLLEVRYQIRYAASMVVAQLKETDCANIILDKLTVVFVVHVERIVQALNEADDCEKKLINLGALEAKVAAKFFADSHWANQSEANETEYFRALADCLVERLIDETHISGRELDGELRTKTSSNIRSAWPSHVCRHFLHELVLSTVLKPALDFLTDPDTLNRFLLMALSSDFDNGGKAEGYIENLTMTENEMDVKVEFLTNLTLPNQMHVPDSLLALKLNDLVREPRLIQLFDMYLRDVRGPTHLLDCFLQARDIHKRVRSLDQREDCTKTALSEIESDAWQLYSGFVHESSPSHIEFLAGVREDFHRAIDDKDLPLLEKATEEVYKRLYQLLNYDYVIPFCQSESYLSYLCGAPPDIEELLRRNASSAADASSADKFDNAPSAFTLSQFRNKLFSFIGNRSDSSFNLKDSMELREEGGGGLEELTYSSTTDYNHLYESQRLQSDQNFDSGSEIALIDLARDLTKWKVTVPNVEIRREAISSKMHFVYVVDVRRYDLDDNKSAHSEGGVAGRNRRLISEKTVEEWDHHRHQPGSESSSNEMNALLSSAATKRLPLPAAVALDSAAMVAPEEDDDSEFGRFSNSDDDGDEDLLPTTWITSRKYDEFFVLEEKLRELYGNSLRLTNLPDRKPFMNRNRSLMEAHRPIFERFLQALVEQPILKRSNLLYDFLTLSEGEWMDEADMGQSIMPDLRNPFRVMRQMPNKFARERGQNLKPFILKMLANVLAPPNVQYSTVLMSNSSVTVATACSADAVSRTSGGGLSSLSLSRPASSAAVSGIVGGAASGSVSLDSDNSHGGGGFITGQAVSSAVADELLTANKAENCCDAVGEATLDGFLKSNGLYGLLMFIMLRIGQLPAWFEALLVGAERLIKTMVNDLLLRRLRDELHDRLLNEEMVILVVNALEAILFPDDNANVSSRKSSNTSTDEEKRLRADLAQRCLDDVLMERVPRWLSRLLQLRFDRNAASFVATGGTANAESSRHQHRRPGGELRTLARHLFTALQFRRLNRQLVFVAVDRVVEQLTSRREETEM